MGAIFSGFGANKAAKRQAQAAQTAAASQARGQKQARLDFLKGRNAGLDSLRSGFTNSINVLRPLVTQGHTDLQAYRSELGLGGRPKGYSGYEESPGFEFAQEQGMRGIRNAFSANGGLNSGEVLKAASRFNTGLAQQDFGNHLSRLSGLAQTGVNARNAMASLHSGYGRDRANVFLGNAANSANTRIGEGNALAEGAIRVGNARAQGTQALFDIPGNLQNEALRTAGAVAGISSFF